MIEKKKQSKIIVMDRMPHKFSKTICLKCYHRWIAVRPETTYLHQLECPSCNMVGYVIETGETVNA